MPEEEPYIKILRSFIDVVLLYIRPVLLLDKRGQGCRGVGDVITMVEGGLDDLSFRSPASCKDRVVEIWNDVAEFGLFLHRGGASSDRLERHLPKMVRKTRVQMMVAKWRRLFRRGGRRK